MPECASRNSSALKGAVNLLLSISLVWNRIYPDRYFVWNPAYMLWPRLFIYHLQDASAVPILFAEHTRRISQMTKKRFAFVSRWFKRSWCSDTAVWCAAKLNFLGSTFSFTRLNCWNDIYSPILILWALLSLRKFLDNSVIDRDKSHLNSGDWAGPSTDVNVVFQRRIETDGIGLLYTNNTQLNWIRHALIIKNPIPLCAPKYFMFAITKCTSQTLQWTLKKNIKMVSPVSPDCYPPNERFPLVVFHFVLFVFVSVLIWSRVKAAAVGRCNLNSSEKKRIPNDEFYRT